MKHLFIITILFISLTNLSAQRRGPSEVSFLTEDKIKINALYQITLSEAAKTPAVILIHQGGSSKEEWLELSLIDKLLKKGYSVLAYDVRQHGKSDSDNGDKNDLFNNPKRAPLDLLAAIEFLKKSKRIDETRIGIIGASIGANLACVASSSDQYPIQSIVSISSKTSAVQNLSGTKEKLQLKNAFHIASKDEQSGKRAAWANELFNLTTGERKIEIPSGNKHGSFIIREHPELEESIVEWLVKTL